LFLATFHLKIQSWCIEDFAKGSFWVDENLVGTYRLIVARWNFDELNLLTTDSNTYYRSVSINFYFPCIFVTPMDA